MDDNLLKIYPNPLGNEKLNIETDRKAIGSELQIFDVAGRLVYANVLTGTNQAFQIQILPGCYLVKITSANISYCTKLLKL
jgi:hypothetical protein